jgi:pyridoxine 5-phosphate synthase
VTKLSVNINKIATLRNARGGRRPDVVQAAIDIQAFGADGITVHPRPDERHIRRSDVYALKEVVHTEFNIEGYPSQDFLHLIRDIRPEQVTLVPDPPEVLTSNAGWDMIRQRSFLQDVVGYLKNLGCRVSLFVDPDPVQVEAAVFTGTDRLELYTEAYARGFHSNPDQAVRPYVEAARKAHETGLGLNAGHDLDLLNLHYFARIIPHLLEVSIGHALICDALYMGLEETIRKYRQCLQVQA